jgi:hypothetical protein
VTQKFLELPESFFFFFAALCTYYVDEKDNRLLTKSSHVSLKSKKARANMNLYLFDIMGNIILVIKYKAK